MQSESEITYTVVGDGTRYTVTASVWTDPGEVLTDEIEQRCAATQRKIADPRRGVEASTPCRWELWDGEQLAASRQWVDHPSPPRCLAAPPGARAMHEADDPHAWADFELSPDLGSDVDRAAADCFPGLLGLSHMGELSELRQYASGAPTDRTRYHRHAALCAVCGMLRTEWEPRFPEDWREERLTYQDSRIAWALAPSDWLERMTQLRRIVWGRAVNSAPLAVNRVSVRDPDSGEPGAWWVVADRWRCDRLAYGWPEATWLEHLAYVIRDREHVDRMFDSTAGLVRMTDSPELFRRLEDAWRHEAARRFRGAQQHGRTL